MKVMIAEPGYCSGRAKRAGEQQLRSAYQLLWTSTREVQRVAG